MSSSPWFLRVVEIIISIPLLLPSAGRRCSSVPGVLLLCLPTPRWLPGSSRPRTLSLSGDLGPLEEIVSCGALRSKKEMAAVRLARRGQLLRPRSASGQGVVVMGGGRGGWVAT